MNYGEAASMEHDASWQSIKVVVGPGERCLRAKPVSLFASTAAGFESLPSPPYAFGSANLV